MLAIYGNTIKLATLGSRLAALGFAPLGDSPTSPLAYLENVIVTATRPGVVGVVVTDSCG